jgi:hypothetical protein
MRRRHTYCRKLNILDGDWVSCHRISPIMSVHETPYSVLESLTNKLLW